MRGLPLAVMSGHCSSMGAWAPHCGSVSCCGAQASVFALPRLSCPRVCVISLDQGSNWCPLHLQVDYFFFLINVFTSAVLSLCCCQGFFSLYSEGATV